MYSEYWNLVKPPFDNVPDASMYVDCHESMENVIAETIYAIKEGNECLTVIVGEVGLGKTLSLRVIIDSLEPEKYKVALITNPALSFVQLLREIIGQITGKQCEVKNKVDLQERFNQLLFETADQGKKIVIVIDEANVLSPSNLDDLRLLTNMQDDERNLFTLLLVGQMEFAKTLEHPKRANLFQRIGTYGHLEKLPSEEAVKDYIEARLRLAGTQRKIFEDDAIPVIWEFSEHGIPRLINKICKLCLKAGETNEFETISGEVAVQIADRFQKLSKTSLPKRKPQITQEPEISDRAPKKTETSRVTTPPSPIETPSPVKPKMLTPAEPPARPVPPRTEVPEPLRPRMAVPEEPVKPIQPEPEEPSFVRPKPRMLTPEEPPARPAPPRTEAPEPLRPKMAVPEEPLKPIQPEPEEPEEIIEPIQYQTRANIGVPPKAVPVSKTSGNFVPVPGMPPKKQDANVPAHEDISSQEVLEESYIQDHQEKYEEVYIGKQKIELAIPSHIIQQAQLATPENKNKLAGYWSAQILKGNPTIMHSSISDPVAVWFEVKSIILKKFNSATNKSSAMTSL